MQTRPSPSSVPETFFRPVVQNFTACIDFLFVAIHTLSSFILTGRKTTKLSFRGCKTKPARAFGCFAPAPDPCRREQETCAEAFCTVYRAFDKASENTAFVKKAAVSEIPDALHCGVSPKSCRTTASWRLTTGHFLSFRKLSLLAAGLAIQPVERDRAGKAWFVSNTSLREVQAKTRLSFGQSR